MVELKLNESESKIIFEVFDEYLSDLRAEIVKTHIADFKEELKTKEALLKRLMDELQMAPVC
jgi:hypothetical protein